jgi:hypothetical protein
VSQSRYLSYLAQFAWFLILVTTALLLAAAVPARLAQLSQVAPQLDTASGILGTAEVEVLRQSGLSVVFYAGYVTFFEALTAFGGVLVGAVIFWRQRHDGMALFVSIALITLGTFPTPLMTSVLTVQPALAPLLSFLQFIALGPSFLIFLVFPDGRFVPRWTIVPGLLWLGYSVGWLFIPALKPPLTLFAVQRASSLTIPILLLMVIIGIFAQIYRYRRVATPVQRQQTKWIVFGFSITLLVVLAFGVASLAVNFDPPSRVSMLFLLIAIPAVVLALMVPPVAVMFSILKFRLWEIDILIRRTVTYAVVVMLSAVVYFSSVILLQQLFAGISGQRSEVTTVLSTLAIAALFVPLRNRVQNAIDKRFNRKKYDAQQVLDDFAQTARDETDLENLTGRLIEVVDETMQPKSVSVWLRRAAGAKDLSK